MDEMDLSGKPHPCLCSPQVPGSQLFVSSQAPERPSRAHGRENHVTLPADWKHRREPHDRGRCLEARGRAVSPAGSAWWGQGGGRACFQRRLGKATGLISTHLPPGASHLDRSYSCSYSHRNGPGPFCHKGMSAETWRGRKPGPPGPPRSLIFFLDPLGPISEEGLGASVMSLSSENPYATIRDLPSLPGEPRESGYVEMKGPPSVSPPRQSLHLRDRQQRQLQPQRDSGTYEQPSPLSHSESSMSPLGGGGRQGTGSREGEGREADSGMIGQGHGLWVVWSQSRRGIGRTALVLRACSSSEV